MSFYVTYPLLLAIKGVSRAFYDIRVDWVVEPADEPWLDLRLVAILNHTSLYEPLLAGGVPNRLLREVARRAVVPVAEKTLNRPLVGRFFRLVAPDVVPVTRQRDQTWQELVDRIGPRSLVVIAPEGRMKRAGGLDAEGKPMTVRGGIADVLRGIPDGKMLIAYSGGLHHVQHPGELLPRPFKRIAMRLEVLDIAAYRAELQQQAGRHGFKHAVIRDLEARRDHHCSELERRAA
ncbi:MAG TPA: 1-acyl-sn-glycerol-3-phosphate acyltransferase [Thermoanaerobaculia bacterium]|nr:1-acyl-sn-glycerol-3-phosphate acyltransferase [Thermoanaerobaculia bacterium]